MKKHQDYFLGLDLGTGSVGWCVTDTEYRILKVNRKRPIGTVLFSTAETAKERRTLRCARRRLRRQKERLLCLQELFREEIEKVDPGFFFRLQESPYAVEEKQNPDGSRAELPYALFVDKDYTDKEFHAQYPTIYHLRKELMDNPLPHDARLVYLAAAHIIKHRGHFLSSISAEGKEASFEELLSQFTQLWNEYMDHTLTLSEGEKGKLKETLLDAGMTKSGKKTAIIRLLGTKEPQLKEMAALLTGASASIEKLFDKEEYKNLEENKIQFDAPSYEEKQEYYREALGDDFEIVARARAIYNWCALSKILKNNPGGRISDARVEDYERHRTDLQLLKKLLSENFPKETQERILKVSEKGLANYPAYIGMTKKNGKKVPVVERCSKEDFYKLLDKEILKNLGDSEEKAYMEQQIRLGGFLPKQKGNGNSVVPYQLHEKELKLILKNAEGYLPFLKEKDESGYTVSEKILQLLTFRIPYYVGPLYGGGGGHSYAWVKRLEDGKVYPWNFEQKIDVEKSAEEFIRRAVSTCSWLKNEKVLPAGSLLFEKFKVLNELNNVRIYGERLEVDIKQRIYQELFCRHLRITKKRLIQYLKKEGIYAKVEPEDISGLDENFQSSLKSLLAFKQIHFDSPVPEQAMEDMIKDITLFGEDPKLLKKRLLVKYPEYGKQIPAIIKTVKCDGWASLSEKLLTGLAVDIPGEGPVGTILYFLWNTRQNLMEILYNPEYAFQDLIKTENGDTGRKDGKISYELVEELYVSPSVKRQIWMALKVIEEVRHFMGCEPKRIFVEMAREKQESKRTSDRKAQIMQLYSAIRTDKDYKELLKELNGCSNDELRKDKLFLYFMQMGRCAYTGKRIPFSDLKYDSLYDIDHIYPRSQTADDSLDNRVLVDAEYNREEKQDLYPIKKETRDEREALWRFWREKKFISDEKYRRLTRAAKLTNEELIGFVNRQLVETRQSTKALAEVLNQTKTEQTEVVYVKAKNVTEFRHRYKLLKVRVLNDFHHAQDAYLNIVVGNVYHLKFTKDVRRYFLDKGTYRTYNLTKMFDETVKCGEETAWNKGVSIGTVKEMMKNEKILVSRQTYEEKGKLYDVQRLKKGQGQVPVKESGRMSDISRYGGYGSAKNTYFMLVEAEDKKKKESLWILPVPLYMKQKIEGSEEYARSYFEQEYSLCHVRVLKKIRIQTLFVYEGFRMRLAGRSGSQLVFHNANELCLPARHHNTIRQISKHIQELQYDKDAAVSDNGLLTEQDLDALYAELCEKLKGSVYQTMLGGYIEKYESGYEKYQKLTLEKKAQALWQMLKIFQCTPEMPDLTLIGGSKSQGAIRMGMNVTGRKSLALIHQSVTGIYERVEKIRG